MDTRNSSPLFSNIFKSGLAFSGIDVYDADVIPSPGVAYLTKAIKADAGVMITASHNPAEYNGFKFFFSDGRKLSDAKQLMLEGYLQAVDVPHIANSKRLGTIHEDPTLPGRYIEFCKRSISGKAANLFSDLKIVVDCANGAGYQIAPIVFAELGAKVFTMGDFPDGTNINHDRGATSPSKLQKTVKATGADFGIALDGDADRIIMVDERGNIIDGDDILYILAKYKEFQGAFVPGVVGTLMTNMGLENRLRGSDIPFVRSDVGDHNVMAMLLDKGWFLGGESSGHIMDLEYVTTGDAIIAALQVIEASLVMDNTLSELTKSIRVAKYHQVMESVEVKDVNLVLQDEGLKRTVIEIENSFSGLGRVLIRPSGTEPVIRVMCETANRKVSQNAVDSIVNLINRIT